MKRKKIEWVRLGIDEYFMQITRVVAERSTCRRHQVGAIAVRDKHILTTGYNGASSGVRDCLELGCLRDKLNIESGKSQEVCRAIHAEQNVIIQGTLHGVSLENATIYCTYNPCRICAKMLINAKVKEVVYDKKYADGEFEDIFDEAKVKYRRYRRKS